MEKIKIFIFICLYIFSLCKNEYEQDLFEGSYFYEIQNNTLYHFTFKAKENGTYFIIFPDYFKFIDATGEISEDINIKSEYVSTVYAQNFQIDDYVKLEYPEHKYIEENKTITIRIEKIEAYFKLFTSINPIIFSLAINDCQKPTYIFTYNNQLESPENNYAFHIKIHSGEFTGSYIDTEYNLNESFTKNFVEFSLSSVTFFPQELSLNTIKLECINPGIVSIYMKKGDDYSILDNIGLSVINSLISKEVSFSNFEFPIDLYIQGFNLVGKTSINLTNINGGVYDEDFYEKITLSKDFPKESHNITINNDDKLTMQLTVFNAGNSNSKILKRNQKFKVSKNNIIIIPLEESNKNDFITIASESGNFYWDYQYSQTDDINYLPKSNYDLKNYQKDKIAKINNPYKYETKQNKYKWFITLVHFNENDVEFSCDIEMPEKNDDEKEDGIGWIFILIILLLLVIGLFYSCFRSIKNQKLSNVEKLM